LHFRHNALDRLGRSAGRGAGNWLGASQLLPGAPDSLTIDADLRSEFEPPSNLGGFFVVTAPPRSTMEHKEMVTHVRVRGSLVNVLAKLAQQEQRSIQFIVERLLREAIQAHAGQRRDSERDAK
jgi:hypothetical protein